MTEPVPWWMDEDWLRRRVELLARIADRRRSIAYLEAWVADDERHRNRDGTLNEHHREQDRIALESNRAALERDLEEERATRPLALPAPPLPSQP